MSLLFVIKNQLNQNCLHNEDQREHTTEFISGLVFNHPSSEKSSSNGSGTSKNSSTVVSLSSPLRFEELGTDLSASSSSTFIFALKSTLISVCAVRGKLKILLVMFPDQHFPPFALNNSLNAAMKNKCHFTWWMLQIRLTVTSRGVGRYLQLSRASGWSWILRMFCKNRISRISNQ